MHVSDKNYGHAGFVRLKQIVGPEGILPIGRSTWWEGVASGRYPKPVKLSPGVTAWARADIEALLKSFEHGETV